MRNAGWVLLVLLELTSTAQTQGTYQVVYGQMVSGGNGNRASFVFPSQGPGGVQQYSVKLFREGRLGVRLPDGNLTRIELNTEFQLPPGGLRGGRYVLDLVDLETNRTLSEPLLIEDTTGPEGFSSTPYQQLLTDSSVRTNHEQIIRATSLGTLLSLEVHDLSTRGVLRNERISGLHRFLGFSPDAKSVWVYRQENFSLQRIALPSMQVIADFRLQTHAAGSNTHVFQHPTDPEINLIRFAESYKAFNGTREIPIFGAPNGIGVAGSRILGFSSDGNFFFTDANATHRCGLQENAAAFQCMQTGKPITTGETVLLGEKFLGRMFDFYGVFDLESGDVETFLPVDRYFALPGLDLLVTQSFVYDTRTFRPKLATGKGLGLPVFYLPSNWRDIPAIQRTFPWLRGAPSIGGPAVLHGASFKGGPLAPGLIATVFGQNLGPEQGSGPFWSSELEVGGLVRGAQVFVGGKPAAILFANRNQINFIVPETVVGQEKVDVQVSYFDFISDPITVPVQSVAPGLFHQQVGGQRYAVGVSDQGTILTPAQSLRKGQFISVFGTGFGLPSGVKAEQVVLRGSRARGTIRAWVGNKEARVDYAGTSPGQLGALVQINVEIPQDGPSGANVALRLETDGVSSDPVMVNIQ